MKKNIENSNKEIKRKVDLKIIPVLKRNDEKKEKLLNELLIKENRLGLKYLEEN